MTLTVERRPTTRQRARVRPSMANVLARGGTAAAWAVGAGLVAFAVPVLLAWATDSRSGSGAAAATRTAGQLWLLAHGGKLAIPGGLVGLTPLGLTAVPLVLLHRAGRHGARTVDLAGLGQVSQLVGAIAFPYAVAAAALTAVTATTSVRPEAGSALLGAFVVAVLGAGSGVLREAGLMTSVRRLPARALRLAAGAAVGTVVLLAGGAALVGLSLAVHAGRATSLASASDPGIVGGLALLVTGVVLVPNAAVWGASWLAGPGFAVGVGTAVGPWGTSLGPVPALPLLAALPGGDLPIWVGAFGLLIPAAAGVLAGVLVSRRLTTVSLPTAALEAAAVGPCVGVICAVLAYLSGGPLGAGRLTQLGPSPWKLALAVTVEVAVPAALTAALAVRRRGA